MYCNLIFYLLLVYISVLIDKNGSFIKTLCENKGFFYELHDLVLDNHFFAETHMVITALNTRLFSVSLTSTLTK